jgi:hypothetical protein
MIFKHNRKKHKLTESLVPASLPLLLRSARSPALRYCIAMLACGDEAARLLVALQHRALLRIFFCAAFLKRAPRRTTWLPTSVKTISVNAY